MSTLALVSIDLRTADPLLQRAIADFGTVFARVAKNSDKRSDGTAVTYSVSTVQDAQARLAQVWPGHPSGSQISPQALADGQVGGVTHLARLQAIANNPQNFPSLRTQAATAVASINAWLVALNAAIDAQEAAEAERLRQQQAAQQSQPDTGPAQQPAGTTSTTTESSTGGGLGGVLAVVALAIAAVFGVKRLLR